MAPMTFLSCPMTPGQEMGADGGQMDGKGYRGAKARKQVRTRTDLGPYQTRLGICKARDYSITPGLVICVP